MNGVESIRIGTSGWSYPSGQGTWNGVFYPPVPKGRGRGRFDDLAYYAERFDTVEVNSTFYGQPRRAVSASWARRTPPGFEFSLKLYQKFTHPKMFEAAERKAGRGPGAERDEPAGPDVEPPAAFVPYVTQTDVDEFRSGIEPLSGADKLGALLAQFPPSFRNTPQAREYLDRLLDSFRGYLVAVELRHRSWSDDVAATLTLLNAHRAAWTQIDEPKFRFSIRQNFLPNVKGFYYMRLHGRNVEKWWRHGSAEERYDYLYSPEELKPFSETADAARTLVKKLYLYLNNHFAAKSVANALVVKHQIGEQIKGDYQQTLVERYPDLARFVSTSPPLLSPTPSG